MTVPHPFRSLRVAAVAVVAALALGGCSMFSPQTTTNVTYAPSDGVQGAVGDLAVRNVFVLTEEQGASAELVGAIFNSSDQQVQVQVTVRQQGEAAGETLVDDRVTVDGNDSVSLGPDADEQVTIEELDVVPGRVVQVSFVGDAGEITLDAPVLDGSLPEYAELLGQQGGAEG